VAQLENVNGGVPNGNFEGGPLRLYEHRLLNGELRPDENQRLVVDHLHKLSHEIENYVQQRRFTGSVISDLTSVCLFL
jgi:predicted ATPase